VTKAKRLPLPLPDEAVDQLRAILASYDRLVAVDALPHVGDDTVIAQIHERLENDSESLSWSDLAQADLCVADILSLEQVKARLIGWRRRMHEVVGDARYAQYLAGASALANITLADARADLAECIRAVYYFYSAYGVAARSRSAVTKSLLRTALVVLVVEAVVGLIVARFWPPKAAVPSATDWVEMIEYLLGTSAAAVLGSIVSVQRRLQDPTVDVDPFYRYIQTTADRFSIAFISPLYGAIFGLVMYALLATKLISSTLVTFKDGVPAEIQSAFALLLFGFLAGFAEQLVPDALTRIAAQALGGVGSTGGSSASLAAHLSSMQSGQQQSAPAGSTDRHSQQPQQPAAESAAPARLSTVPTDITPEAAALGQDAGIASAPRAEQLVKGIVA
jgi:hypothetical protein